MSRRLIALFSTLLLLLPVLGMLYLSLVKDWAYPNMGTVDINALFLEDKNELLWAFALSLLLSGSIAAAATFFGFLMSWQLAQKRFLFQLAFYPYLIAPVILGVMLQFYFVRMGLSGSVWGVLLAQMLFIFPYGILVFATFWNDRLQSLVFQATTLGASPRQVFITLLMPMARPWLFFCFVQCFLISWFEYGITQLVGVGKIQTLPIKIMFFIKEANPHLAALSALMMLLPALVLLLINRRLRGV